MNHCWMEGERETMAAEALADNPSLQRGWKGIEKPRDRPREGPTADEEIEGCKKPKTTSIDD